MSGRTFLVAAENIQRVVDTTVWRNEYELPTRAWTRYDGAITARLKPDDLELVAETMIQLAQMTRKVDARREKERGFDSPFKHGIEVGAATAYWWFSRRQRKRGEPIPGKLLPWTWLQFDDPSDAAEWKALAENVTGAYNALAGLAGESRVADGLLVTDIAAPAPPVAADSQSTSVAVAEAARSAAGPSEPREP